MNVMNRIGGIDDVVGVGREVQVLGAGYDAFQLHAKLLTQSEGGCHHLRRNIHDRDSGALQREVNRGLAEACSNIEQFLSRQRTDRLRMNRFSSAVGASKHSRTCTSSMGVLLAQAS